MIDCDAEYDVAKEIVQSGQSDEEWDMLRDGKGIWPIEKATWKKYRKYSLDELKEEMKAYRRLTKDPNLVIDHKKYSDNITCSGFQSTHKSKKFRILRNKSNNAAGGVANSGLLKSLFFRKISSKTSLRKKQNQSPQSAFTLPKLFIYFLGQGHHIPVLEMDKLKLKRSKQYYEDFKYCDGNKRSISMDDFKEYFYAIEEPFLHDLFEKQANFIFSRQISSENTLQATDFGGHNFPEDLQTWIAIASDSKSMPVICSPYEYAPSKISDRKDLSFDFSALSVGKKMTTEESNLREALQKLCQIEQQQANEIVCNRVLKITDPDMQFIVENDLLIKIADHLQPQRENNSKPKNACLVYGHPGAGKTRLFHELAAALLTVSGPTSDFRANLSRICRDVCIDINQVTLAAVTFNSDTRATSRDVELCDIQDDLPVALRLFFVYFVHSYPRNSQGFEQIQKDLLTLIKEDEVLRVNFTVKNLLDTILQRSGKQHLVLVVDETLALLICLRSWDTTSPMAVPKNSDNKFKMFMSSLNQLQDASSGVVKNGETCISVIFSGLLDGPWTAEASTSGRNLLKFLLAPIPPTSAALNLIASANGLRSLIQYYRVIRGTINEAFLIDSVSKYLFHCSAGLPRALEILRQQLQKAAANHTLHSFLTNSAQALQSMYLFVADKLTLHLALFGKEINGHEEGNKAFVARLHTYMSEGRCLLLTLQDSDGFVAEDAVVVSIPPLRLLGTDFARIKCLSNLIGLTSEMNSKNFEHFLLYHELMMRSVRNDIAVRGLMHLFTAPHCNVDLRHATLQELYFGDANGNDIKVEWRDETLRNGKFDFTTPLDIMFMDLPHYRDFADFVNCIIISPDANQKGFEYSLILQTKEQVPRPIVVAIQAKFTEVDSTQEIDKMVDTGQKCFEVICSDTAIKFAALGWPQENMVVLFQTNRTRRKYRTIVKGFNMILMCKDSLKKYLGVTVWGLLQSCHYLANLQLVVNAMDV